jgi:hypothetical protein
MCITLSSHATELRSFVGDLHTLLPQAPSLARCLGRRSSPMGDKVSKGTPEMAAPSEEVVRPGPPASCLVS